MQAENKFMHSWLLLLALIIGILLGISDVRSDDTGITAGLILIFAAFLASAQPKHFWQPVVILGLSIPVANLLWIVSNNKYSLLLNQGLGSFMAIGFALVGGLIGLAVRQSLTPTASTNL